MPYVHQYIVNVRHYECNAFGRLHPATILGYLQEAAFDASSAVGWSAAHYAEVGLQWLAYETEIEYLYLPEHPIGYPDQLEIRTWVADMRRVRSLRRYELRRAGELVARASTDWVLIDANSHLPTSIPPEVVNAYSRGEGTPATQQRPAFPRFPATPEGAFTLRRRVEWRDIDPAVHVNNAVYVHYAAEAERQALRAAGISIDKVTPRRHQIEYKLAAVIDDELDITTWTDESGVRFFTVTRAADGKLIARIREEYAVMHFGL